MKGIKLKSELLRIDIDGDGKEAAQTSDVDGRLDKELFRDAGDPRTELP